MESNERAFAPLDKWFQEWVLSDRKLSFKEAKRALTELDALVEQYFSAIKQKKCFL